MRHFDVSSVVLCDDVRQEANGKHILIGVYIDSVLVVDFPTNISLTIWVVFKPNEIGEFPGEIRVIKDDDSVLLRGESKIIIRTLDPSTAIFQYMPLVFQQGGKYLFQWKFDDDEWETVKEFTVQKRPTTPADEQPQES